MEPTLDGLLTGLLDGRGVAVGGLVLDGRDEANLAVQASVVEPVNVLSDGVLEVVDVLPWSAVADQFSLEERVERLGQGVVVGLSG